MRNSRALLSHIASSQLVRLMLLALVAMSVAYQAPVTVELGQAGAVLSGFYDVEGRSSARPYRWTDGHARVWLAGIGGQAYQLVLTLSSARPNDASLPSTTVRAGGALLGSFNAPRPVRDFPFELGADTQSPAGDMDIRIDSETFAPPGDLRTLGVIVYGLRLEPSPGPHLVWPAPVAVSWGMLVVALLYLALRRWEGAARAAWPAAAAALVVVCVGIAVARLQTVAVLPWGVLVASGVFAVARARGRREGE